MKEFLENQYKNLFLYSPFVIAFGAGLYFSIGTEPNFHFPILITLLLSAIIFINKNLVIRTLALFLFGFFYSMSFTHIINTPQIRDSFGKTYISGDVYNLDFKPDSTYVFLKTNINEQNVNLRLKFIDNTLKVNIGDTINGHAMIFHPGGMEAPDSFDFARWAYFNKISGTGYMTDFYIKNTNKNSTSNLRNFIHDKSKSFLTDTLFLGYKKSLPEQESHIWKSIGLGHVWSISGFHMTLVGGWLFALFYLVFRLFAPITRRIPAKYPAMICAWFGLVGYLILSGISVATTRAFLMTTLIFIAAVFNRGALSLRNAVLVFLVIFLINPFYVMHAGFQLSFAAIFGLLWFFQDTKYVKRNFLQRTSHIVWITLETAFIATLFTLPFIMAHFGYIPTYSLIGNLIILPIFSFVIMPMVIIGTICALFNYHYIINLSHNIYNFTLNISEHISGLPMANLYVPHVPNYVLVLCIIGMISIVLIVKYDSNNFIKRNINYAISSMFLLSAMVLYINVPRPIFYSTTDNTLVGFVVDNKIQFNKSRATNHFFAFNTWRRFNYEEPSDKNIRYKCKNGLCTYENIVYIKDIESVIDNIGKICNNKSVKLIVSPVKIKAPNCNARILRGGVLIYKNNRIKRFYNRRLWHKTHA